MDAYRFSIEWARIEPEEGIFDDAALGQYREQTGTMVDAGIKPALTLHHFSIPRWLLPKGGLAAKCLPALLERMTRRVAHAVGDLVPTWVTINEPNVVTSMGYLFGEFPPGKTNAVVEMLRAQHLLLEAHTRMYRALHEELDATREIRVGGAHHLRVFVPARSSRRRDRVGSRTLKRLFNDGFAGALCGQSGAGRALDQLMRAATGFSVAAAAGTHDFFGINYYSRDLVRISPREGGLVRDVAPGAEVTALGWEVYPEGLGTLCEEWGQRSGRPILITENGCADATDVQRPSFLVRHLREVADARRRGVDIRGYYHWSLMDNWEWAEGYVPRFGLVAIDDATGDRTMRKSGELYRDIAAHRAISDQQWAEFGAPPQDVARR